MESIEEALLKRGFSFIEVLAPCPVNYGRRNREKPLDSLRIYQERTIIKNNAHPSELDIDFEKGVILGKFIDQDRPTCTEMYDKTCRPTDLSEESKAA
jgi:2-oxoglutarate ferredoxin oxidoreductase subunit beta